ncbi:hypothetical protein MMAN_04270 [Mycobacterium mantenii]|uniref:DUF4352 domain-containing protein n=2 Tax=Mycobacterium mantenii TaxID=560555 RepID=A0ABN6A3J7_MYCNT|nr:hypothetical protein MMAN_04270 [Mycobacterium mantenii]
MRYLRAVTRPFGMSALATTLALTACVTAPHGTADPTPQQSPFPTGKSGTSIHVTEYSTATADVTLNGATWVSSGCSGGRGCNVIELTIAGKSNAPFTYSQTSVTAASSPWRQDPNRDVQGGSSMVDYQKINKMPPLRAGSVTNGQTAHGFVAYDGNINQGDVYIEFNDPDAPAAPTPLAGWKVHT